MSGKTDQVKGRVKEAAGVLTDDKSLKREGAAGSGGGEGEGNRGEGGG
jgi:uncharacterized protein YjbJ (UPF0337 family)